MNEQNRDGYNDFMAVLKSVDAETVAADTGSGAEWAELKASIVAREQRDQRQERGETADEEAVSDEPAHHPLEGATVPSRRPGRSAGQLTAHLVPLVVLAAGVMAWTTFHWMWVRIVGVGLILLAFLGNDLLRLLSEYRAERPDRRSRRGTGMAASALTAAAVTAVASVVPDIGH
ncbi:hypothetical protein ACFY1P_00935 [Streptomyces sp. NPDC001407]|uniref:hypothetical protein n=1 Tax=unclassified Streptomyces TaxID=2593676 RepID=UPI0033C85712